MGDNIKLRLKEVMQEQSISIRKLSFRSGISRTNISNLMSGEYNNPTIRVVVALSKALNVPIDRLIEC